MEEIKKIKILIISVLIFLLSLCSLVIIIDPLYLYHGPILGMEPVLYDSTLQVEGTIKNFDYDSVLIGSSMVENVDITNLNETYGIQTLKVTKESGSIADLLFYLNETHKYQKLKYVLMGIDIYALTRELEPSIPSEYTPEYLFTNQIIDDAPYIFNKDIILEKIPLFISYSLFNRYNMSKAYYFADGKDFSVQGALSNYDRLEEISDIKEYDKELIDKNIENLVCEIRSHQETTYKLFFHPYSILWWDNIYREGSYEGYLYAMEKSLMELTLLENAEVYFFVDEKEIAFDLSNYMDPMHFKPEINEMIMNSLNKEDEHYIKNSEVENLTKKVREMFDDFISNNPYF